MLRLTFLLGFSALLFSCNKKMGGFQPSSRIDLSSGQKIKISDKSSANYSPILIEDLNTVNTEYEASISNELPLPTVSIPSFNKPFLKNSSKSFNSSKQIELTELKASSINEKSSDDAQIHQNLKRNPVFNDSLKIGLVFLVIAAGLAFLPALLQLAVLFALVAMIFLFIGLKKLFNRRAKIKQKKIRKENNQIRKEKVKDIFRK